MSRHGNRGQTATTSVVIELVLAHKHSKARYQMRAQPAAPNPAHQRMPSLWAGGGSTAGPARKGGGVLSSSHAQAGTAGTTGRVCRSWPVYMACSAVAAACCRRGMSCLLLLQKKKHGPRLKLGSQACLAVAHDHGAAARSPQRLNQRLSHTLQQTH